MRTHTLKAMTGSNELRGNYKKLIMFRFYIPNCNKLGRGILSFIALDKYWIIGSQT